jgi:membrane-associated protease RseP (regulator of RpoE activity)
VPTRRVQWLRHTCRLRPWPRGRSLPRGLGERADENARRGDRGGGAGLGRLGRSQESGRAAAVEALHLQAGPTLTWVAAGGPAELAGLRAGDALVSLNGAPVPTGRGSEEKLAEQMAALIKAAPAAPLAIEVRRADQLLTLRATPVMTCDYGVVVEEGSDINAFADGRTIHVLRPMLRLAQSDEELALIIAHELAHNGQHHIQARVHNARMVGFGGLLLDGIAAAGGVNTGGAFTKAGVRLGAEHGAVAFEAEADYVGMYYMARAGYSTAGVETVWRKMAVEYPDAIFVKTDHPPTPERFLAIAAASAEIEGKRARGEPLLPNALPVAPPAPAN